MRRRRRRRRRKKEGHGKRVVKQMGTFKIKVLLGVNVSLFSDCLWLPNQQQQYKNWLLWHSLHMDTRWEL